MKRFPFSRAFRLRRSADFETVLSQGARAGDARLTLWVLANGLPVSRFGLMVGRKHGGAVRRNRIKRVLREAFRLCRPDLPAGFDLVCSPRAGVKPELKLCMASLTALATRLSRRPAAR